MAERLTLTPEELLQLYANQSNVLSTEEIAQYRETREQWENEGNLPEDMTAQNIAEIETFIRERIEFFETTTRLFGSGSVDMQDIRDAARDLEFLDWKGYLTPEFRSEMKLKLREARQNNKFKNSPNTEI